jgi:hypothetical protein
LNSLYDLDIYQPRESLNGYSLASVLVMEPKEFDAKIKLKVSDDQKTLLEEFVVLANDQSGINDTIEDIVQGFELVFRDDLLLRNHRDV